MADRGGPCCQGWSTERPLVAVLQESRSHLQTKASVVMTLPKESATATFTVVLNAWPAVPVVGDCWSTNWLAAAGLTVRVSEVGSSASRSWPSSV